VDYKASMRPGLPFPPVEWAVPAWAWLVLGLAFLAAEILTPGGFFFLFFGAGAIAVGLIATAGLTEFWIQILLFTLFSAVSLGVFRRRLVRAFSPPLGREVDSIAGEEALALHAIEPGAEGQVELRGAIWKAQNVGTLPILAGQRCLVEEVSGLWLRVRTRAEGER
jgi:inner membrane protein